MFKNYLTYSFVQNFQLACRELELPPRAQERLLRSADQMVHGMLRSIHATDPKDEVRFLVAALLSIRDCRATLEEAGAFPPGGHLRGRYDVAHGRLEKLCLAAAKAEGGQLRMLG